MKQIGSLIVVVNKSIYFQFSYPILQTTYQNNFFVLARKSIKWVSKKWIFRAACSVTKILCIQAIVSKKRTWAMLGNEIMKVYQTLSVYGLYEKLNWIRCAICMYTKSFTGVGDVWIKVKNSQKWWHSTNTQTKHHFILQYVHTGGFRGGVWGAPPPP